MKPLIVLKPLIVSAIALVLPVAGSAQAGNWTLDPAHSSAEFAVKHMGISTVRGDFTKLSGSAQYDPADVSKDSVEVTIDVSSVDTRNGMRDNDLKSDHWFDVGKYPSMTFKSTKIEDAGSGKLKVTGDLTLHGVTKPVTLDVEGPSKPIDDGRGHLHMGVSATGTLDRTQFGMTGGTAMVGSDISLTIDAELIRPSK